MKTIKPAKPIKPTPIEPIKPQKPGLPTGPAGYQTCRQTFLANPLNVSPELYSSPFI
ncbi:hypothetical protein [Methanosarcina sp.]|uniref:hypothetical protein n=1 Tax=Methanosarcina sp. TaxID=2213 RepID=UPI002AB80271|nr:hypothetical protein [Methanosarcina sp.]MDY9926135.1 hypothetical protein [Methanosarcina sp.]